MWRRLFFSRPRFLTSLSTANYSLISRHTAARTMLLCADRLLQTLIPSRCCHFNSQFASDNVSSPYPEVGMMDVVSKERSDAGSNAGNNAEEDQAQPSEQKMSKRAQKKLLKQQKHEAKKVVRKAAEKEHNKQEAARKRKEWEEKLASMDEEERVKLIDARRGLKKERVEKKREEKAGKIERLRKAKEQGQNIIIDLEFAHLMSPNETNSLTQQIMYCYAMNRRSRSPSHLWLTGFSGDMETQLLKIPGYSNWMIEKESRSYVEALQDRKDDLVYLTADSEVTLDTLDSRKLYIVGGLVDRNRWKGITMKKATKQGIQTAKLPIGAYLKMSSSQVLTVNQVIKILLKFIETGDWKTSFFHVIPQRKRCKADSDAVQEAEQEEDYNGNADKQCEANVCLDNSKTSTS